MRSVFEFKVAPNKRHDFVLKIKRHYKLHHVKRSAMLLHGLLIHSILRLKKSVWKNGIWKQLTISVKPIIQKMPLQLIYFLANVIFMAWVGVILNPWRASLAALLCNSVANSTNAISWRFGTKRTSLKPGNWLNNIDNIISLVSSGKLVKKRIWFGGCSAVGLTLPSVAPGTFFFLSLFEK